MPAVVTRSAPIRAQEPQAEEPRKGVFGFLGRKEKKAEPVRMEPASRQAPQRATAQVIARPSDAQRPADTAEDLFPDQKKDDQFEIPAFLRRQTN
jgi:hypothetical protein